MKINYVGEEMEEYDNEEDYMKNDEGVEGEEDDEEDNDDDNDKFSEYISEAEEGKDNSRINRKVTQGSP